MLRKTKIGVKENAGHFVQRNFFSWRKKKICFEERFLKEKELKEYFSEVGIEEEEKESMRMVC